MTRATLLALVLLSSAEASAYQICVSSYVTLTDVNRALYDGSTEDYWKSGGLFRELRGAEYTVRRVSSSGSVVSSGYLGDGTGSVAAGCTPSFTPPTETSFLWLEVKSQGSVRGNSVKARDDDTLFKDLAVFTTTIIHPNVPSPANVSFTGGSTKLRDIWGAYAVGAFALYRSAGGLTGQGFALDVYHEDGKYKPFTNHYRWPDVKLTNKGANRKYVVVHELAHRLADLANADWDWTVYDYLDTACPASNEVTDDDEVENRNTHSLVSNEYQASAFNEGFAHFYAARVWNSNAEDGCVFNHYKREFGIDLDLLAIDCEGALSMPRDGGNNDRFPVGYLEEKCSQPFSNHGTELDWLRQLWDVYTNGATENQPTFPEMVDWMRDAFVLKGWGATPYSELDYEANVVGGQLNTNWDAMDDVNAVSYP